MIVRTGAVARILAGVLRPPGTTRTTALAATERVSALTHLLISVEHLARPGLRQAGGLNDWSLSGLALADRRPRTARFMAVVADDRVTTALHASRAAAALVLLSPCTDRRVRLTADVVAGAAGVLTHPRVRYGTDGSDQVSVLVQGAAALARLAGERTKVVDAALWGIALQACMSYAVSGWAKLAGSSWRTGEALPGVMRTETYGHAGVWRAVRRHPRVARALGAGMLLLECTFPLVYLAGGRLAKPYVVGAAGFHVVVARVMGLGRFVPSFLSMHPAVLYTVRSRAGTGGAGVPTRHDAVPAAALVTVIATAVYGQWVRSRDQAVLAEHRPGDGRLITSAGNVLVHSERGPADADVVFVLENGMASSTESWEWIARGLAVRHAVVTYDRAGYGSSTWRKGTASSLGGLADETRQLVDHVARGRRVVLVGHSLGGYLAMLAARTTTADVVGLGLVDSSHPDELVLSEKQARGARHLDDVLPVMVTSLDLGWGCLVKRPDFVDRLPSPTTRRLMAQYRTSRLWRAGLREWRAVRAEFETSPGLPPLDVPVQVLTAARTVSADDVQGELHQRILDAAPGGAATVVPDCDHDSILTDRVAARHVVAALSQLAVRREVLTVGVGA